MSPLLPRVVSSSSQVVAQVVARVVLQVVVQVVREDSNSTKKVQVLESSPRRLGEPDTPTCMRA